MARLEIARLLEGEESPAARPHVDRIQEETCVVSRVERGDHAPNETIGAGRQDRYVMRSGLPPAAFELIEIVTGGFAEQARKLDLVGGNDVHTEV